MPSTLRRGSIGSDVSRWQGILGVQADGNFGPQTEAATKAWQLSHKLVADGVVGPATWAAALGTSAAVTRVQKTAAAPTDEWAYQVAKSAAPQDSEKLRQYILTIARGEGFYGKGWGSPSQKTIADSATFGLTGLEGANSNNWGATQGTGDAGSFPHVDYHADGSPYVGQYKMWSTPEKGYLDMRGVLLSGEKLGQAGAAALAKAINAGNLHDAVYQQHANGYFELAPDQYLSRVVSNYNVLTANTGWQQLLSEKGISVLKTALKWLGWTAALVLGGGAAYSLSRK